MEMEVKLINYTPNPERAVAIAARLCYSPLGVGDLMERMTEEKVTNFLQKLLGLGHYSALEHASFTFAIEGISRVTTHQLVRHRLASYSQQSQRYVKEREFEYIVPPTIVEKEKPLRLFEEAMVNLQKVYNLLLEAGIPPEDARYVLPNATETKIIVTMNARELLHFFKLRCCQRAQWEIQRMADRMLMEVKKVAPHIFKQAGPACLKGPCPEGEMSCGKLKEVRRKYRDLDRELKA